MIDPKLAARARRWLSENGSEIQKRLDADGEGFYLCAYIYADDGEPAFFVTKDDELIVEYYQLLRAASFAAAVVLTGKPIGRG